MGDINVQPDPQRLQVTDTGLYHMQDAAKWIKFMGIVMAIMTGLTALCALIIMVKASFMFGLLYLIFAAIDLYPTLKSLGIAKHFRAAIDTTDDDELTEGLSNLRQLFTFMGILTIIALVFIAIGMIGVIGTLNEVNKFTSSF